MTDKHPKDSSQEPTHRAWERLVFAQNPIEAIMVESFLAGEGIETRQPFERHLMYDAGIGPGVAGEPGVRIDVPADQLSRAKELLDERQRLVKQGELKVDAEDSELATEQELEAAIEKHSPALPAKQSGDTFMRLLFFALGIVGMSIGAAHYFQADQVIAVNSFISHQSEAVFVTIVGIAFIFAGVLQSHSPTAKVSKAQSTPLRTTPPATNQFTFGFLIGSVLMFGYSFVAPALGTYLYASQSTADPSDIAVILFLVAIFILPIWGTWLATVVAIWRKSIPNEHRARILLRYYIIGAMAPVCILPPILMFEDPQGEVLLTLGFSIVSILLLWKHLIPAQLRDLRPIAIPLTSTPTKADHASKRT